jgi:hypothetical protein
MILVNIRDSDKAKGITGQAVVMDGGYTAIVLVLLKKQSL